ncbi:DNA (cytosine-5-)-methyltransferase [bacterium]|nr:DNA (cytosine-5-)-methyltransferase [bacterium]
MIKVGSDFSGVGAFNQALIRLGIEYEEVFACDMDKYARQTFIHNYGEPKYYPTNVYDREIPSEPLDIYMTSPPCQAFSLAGKRLGKEDKRGILFFNSHEFIQKNNPRYFIFENVKGLLSDNGGKTFSEWVNLLGGKSINGNPVIFPHEDSVPYHLYWQVLNAKHHGVPQNRERVFLIGIRDDQDNKFQFPREEHLSKRLKDVLEDAVDEKYFLSEKMISGFMKHNEKHNKKGTGFTFEPKDKNDIAACLRANAALAATDNTLKIGDYRKDDGFRWREDGNSPTLCARAREDGSGQAIVMQLNQSKESGGVQPYQQNRVYDSNGISPAMNAGQVTWGGNIVTLPNEYKIRRLTPRECFRLMDFPDTFTWPVSDSQAYKQAGNSIVVGVLTKILSILLC